MARCSSIRRVHRELNVGTAGLYAYLADDGQTGIPHALIFFVRQRLRWSDRDRISRMDSHRIKVFNGANDHDVVVQIAHDLHLVFFPTQDRLFNQHFRDG